MDLQQQQLQQLSDWLSQTEERIRKIEIGPAAEDMEIYKERIEQHKVKNYFPIQTFSVEVIILYKTTRLEIWKMIIVSEVDAIRHVCMILDDAALVLRLCPTFDAVVLRLMHFLSGVIMKLNCFSQPALLMCNM